MTLEQRTWELDHAAETTHSHRCARRAKPTIDAALYVNFGKGKQVSRGASSEIESQRWRKGIALAIELETNVITTRRLRFLCNAILTGIFVTLPAILLPGWATAQLYAYLLAQWQVRIPRFIYAMLLVCTMMGGYWLTSGGIIEKLRAFEYCRREAHHCKAQQPRQLSDRAG